MTLKRIGIGATACILLLGAAFVWQWRRDRRRPPDVTFAVSSWPTARLIYAADAQGLFLKQDVAVHILDAGDRQGAVSTAIQQSRAEGGIMPLVEATLLAESGVPLQIVASADYSNGAMALITDSSLAGAADLRGRRIAVENNDANSLFLQLALKQGALTSADVTLVREDAQSSIQSFLAREVEAVVATQPFLNLVASRQGSRELFSSRELPGDFPDVIVFREDYLRGHRQVVAKFLRAWFELFDFMGQSEAQRREILAVVALTSGVPLDQVESEFEGIALQTFADNAVAFTHTADAASLYASVGRIVTFLNSQGRLQEGFEAATMLEPSFVRGGLKVEDGK